MIAILLGFCAYFAVAPAHVLGGDHGEFVALAHSPGIAHPPGYPLYVLYLRLMSWLPGEGARASSLATAFLGGVQLILLYVAARLWRAPALASGIAVACYSVSALAVHLNSHAEVFALNGLLAAAMLVLAAEGCVLPPTLRALACGLVFGLGLSNHHSIIFLFPLLLITVWSASCSRLKIPVPSFARLMPLSLMGVAAGLLPYLLLITWSQQKLGIFYSWRGVHTFYGLLHHFLRSDYGSLSLSGVSEAADPAAQQLLLLDSLGWSWHLLLPCAAVGLFFPLASERVGSARWWRWLALLTCVLAAGPFFVSMFNLGVVGAPRPALLERFHLLPVLLLVVPVSSGLSILVRLLRRLLGADQVQRSAADTALRPLLAVLLVGFASFFSAAIAASKLQDRQSPEVECYLLNGLHSMPFGSMVLVKGDHRLFGNASLQATGRRRDLLFVAAGYWRHSWYRQRLKLSNPALVGGRDLGNFVKESLKNGRPVYMDSMAASTPEIIKSGLLSYQSGLYRRFLRPGERYQDPVALLRSNERFFASYVMPPAEVGRADGWPMVIRMEYRDAWNDLAADLLRLGRPDLAVTARRRAVEYGPCYADPCPAPRPLSAVARSS